MRMRNVRTAEKKRNANESDISQVLITNESIISVGEIAERERNDIEFLKITVVNDANLPFIKAKIQSTLSYRWKLMKEPELDLREIFPYFFTHSTLVRWGTSHVLFHFITAQFLQILFDFSVRYKEIDCNAFLDTWPTHSVRLNDILKDQYESSIYTMWTEDIQDLLILLKLLPAKTNGRNLLSVESFNKATEKLFVFRKVRLHLRITCNAKCFLTKIPFS